MRFALFLAAACCVAANRPNVIIVLSDDQGYGDFGAHGNPSLKTPNLDVLRGQSARLTDFHVAPMCTPTRSQLMTGQDCLRNGASAVCSGRALVRPGIPFLPEHFKKAGYKTGLFGKWHLGDSYPHRPGDRGFDEALHLQGWGVSSVADRWNNDCFDGTWLHNGAAKKYTGYCTDVFFAEAMKWMGERAKNHEPFFCYLPTNAPHGPLWCPEEFRKPYTDLKLQKPLASFYGMIANLDSNLGKLMSFLDDRMLRENTIIIYFHDNGGTVGVKHYNAGLRAGKTTYYEGGHRAACFWRGPGIKPGELNGLTHVQDVLPSLLELCDLPKNQAHCDGESLAGRLKGEDRTRSRERRIVVQYGESPGGSKLEKDNACVCWNREGKKWRLVHGKELYEVSTDLGQTENLASKHPEIVKELKDYYETWWSVVGPRVNDYVPIVLGAPQQPSVTLTSADWSGTYADNAPRDVRGGLKKNGPWHVSINQGGEFEIRLRRWPVEADAALAAGVPKFPAKDGELAEGKALPVAKVRLTIGAFDEIKTVTTTDREAVFTVKLDAAKNVQLQGYLLDVAGRELAGAYYANVTRKQ